MIHTFIGDLGHFFVVISLVAALLAAYSYFNAARQPLAQPDTSWLKLGRISFWLHSLAVLGTVISLFIIIYNHYFEYHYAWSHSSRSLPVHYMISCFWEGQEGSFLLWSFWQALLGLVMMYTNKRWEAPVLAVFALVQAFLASMILGVIVPGDIKIGSSPFILLREVMDAPVFAINPNYVPEDGTGLNPLLQNYWMVIHPPTLFLGFALTLIPFAYCIAGLWQRDYINWIRPALPWTSAAALILGIGILMGAYWAYETLNFGGYWNWDPVENAVYIPWLVLVAALHLMIVYRKNGTALGAAMILTIASFVLVLYSTFLTRSGILGNASVHSFTDLGLSGQLLIYLLAFVVLSVWLLFREWKNIPSTEEETSVYSREFWIFIGATTLCLMSFQVLIPTSIPVYNKFIELFGGISNLAPPTDPISFYSKFQLWFAVAIALLSGTGQFFWWQKMDGAKLKEAMLTPLIISVVLGAAALAFSGVRDISFMILLLAAIYAIVSNFTILLRLKRSSFKLAGGSVAHIGIAMILIGILFSSGYSRVISQNTSGLLYSRDFADEVNRDNLLLFLNKSEKMQEYSLTYRGPRIEVYGVPGYVDKNLLLATPDPNLMVARNDYATKENKYFSAGDTVKIYAENTYYQIDYAKENGEQFSLFPRAQVNPNMGFIASPDIKRGITSDLYTHVSVVPDNEQEPDWGEAEMIKAKIGQQFFVNDYVAVVERLEQVANLQEFKLAPNDIAVKAHIKIYGEEHEYFAEPVYILRRDDKSSGTLPVVVNDLAIKIGFSAVHPEEDSVTFAVNRTQKDYIILKAMEKPLINVLWTGTLLLVIGFGIAIQRRYSEFRSMRNKAME